MNNIQNKLLITYLLLIFCFFLYIIDSFGYIINSGDFAWPFSYLIHSPRMFLPWDDSVNSGYFAARQVSGFIPWGIIFYYIEYMGVNNLNIQYYFNIFSVIISIYGTFLLTNFIFDDFKISTLASLIFTFSNTAILLSESSFGNSAYFFYYINMQSFLYLAFFKYKKIIYLLLILLSPISLSYTNPAYILCTFFYVCVLIYLANNLFLNFNIIFKILGILFITNLNLVLNILLNFNQQFDIANNFAANLPNDLNIAKGDSISVVDAILGNGTNFWFVFGGQDSFKYTSWGFITNNIFYRLILAFIFIYYFLYFPIDDFNKKFLYIYIVSIVLISGLKSPLFLESILSPIYSNEYLTRIFRSNYLKLSILNFYLSTIIISKVLFSFKISAKLFLFLLFILLCVQISQQRYRALGQNFPSQKIIYPDSYYKLKNFSGNYIVYPQSQTYNVALSWDNHTSFMGADFIRSAFGDGALINKKIIYSQLELCYKYNNNCNFIAKHYNINYIIVRKDVDINQPSIWGLSDSLNHNIIINHYSNNHNIVENNNEFFIVSTNIPFKQNDMNFNFSNDHYIYSKLFPGIYYLKSYDNKFSSIFYIKDNDYTLISVDNWNVDFIYGENTQMINFKNLFIFKNENIASIFIFAVYLLIILFIFLLCIF